MRVWVVLASALLALPAHVALAEVYKYVKPDGTVVYTDNVSQLPRERQEHYERLRQEREAKRKELERSIGKEELERREAEAKRAELAKASMADAERVERTRVLDEVLADIQRKRAAREATKAVWENRVKQARAELEKKLAAFAATTERHNQLAIQPSFALLPGQAEELEKLRAELKKLEGEIDALVILLEETIPEEARKAGIPPGWIR